MENSGTSFFLFFFFFTISIGCGLVTPHWNHLGEMVLVKGHNICFNAEIWKIISKLSVLSLLICDI